MTDLTCTVTRHIGILYTEPSGWALELNEVSWNGRPPRLELRKWAPDYSRSEKGIPLTQATLKSLIPLLEKELKRDGE